MGIFHNNKMHLMLSFKIVVYLVTNISFLHFILFSSVYIYINENVLYLCPLFTQEHIFQISFILEHPLFIINPRTPIYHHLS